MATFLKGAVPAAGPYRQNPEPLLSLRQMSALVAAPRKDGQGTRVTVRSAPIPITGNTQEHMYVEYDDGRDRLIARGEPSPRFGLPMLNGALGDDLRVAGSVVPAAASRDFGQGRRVVFDGFLPGQSARQASSPAVREARDLERDPRRYGFGANSNSYAADAVEALFGIRPGGNKTPGWKTPLATAPRTQPVHPASPEGLRRRWHAGAGG